MTLGMSLGQNPQQPRQKLELRHELQMKQLVERTVLITRMHGPDDRFVYSKYDSETGKRIFEVRYFSGMRSLAFSLKNQYGSELAPQIITVTPEEHWRWIDGDCDLLDDAWFEEFLDVIQNRK